MPAVARRKKVKFAMPIGLAKIEEGIWQSGVLWLMWESVGGSETEGVDLPMKVTRLLNVPMRMNIVAIKVFPIIAYLCRPISS